MAIDEMDKDGVTEDDINHLFPLTAIQVWLRDKFIDSSIA